MVKAKCFKTTRSFEGRIPGGAMLQKAMNMRKQKAEFRSTYPQTTVISSDIMQVDMLHKTGVIVQATAIATVLL